MILTVYINPILPKILKNIKIKSKLKAAIESIETDKSPNITVGEVVYILENAEQFEDILGWDIFSEYISKMNKSFKSFKQ